MIRFRVGRRWKREPSGPPVDSFGLELEGVDLLAGASAERLDVVVPELVDAVSALFRGETSIAQVSLPEVHRVLALWLRGSDVRLSVIGLSRPAKQLRPPISVPLEELAQATRTVARALLDELPEETLSKARRRALLRELSRMEGAPAHAEPRLTAHVHEVPAPPLGFGLRLDDREELAGRYSAEGHGALTSLLAPGKVWFRGEGEDAIWSADALPALFALELARQAGELTQAIEFHEPLLSFHPGGVGSEVVVAIAEGTVRIGKVTVALPAAELARQMFRLAAALPPLLRHHHRAQAKNPYLHELTERSREGLSHLREATPAAEARPATRKTKGRKAPPLATAGKLRRLRFEPLWTKERLGGDTYGSLLASPAGPIFASGPMAVGLSPSGELRFRRLTQGSLAVSPSGEVLATDGERNLLFVGDGPSAKWFGPSDGLGIGPELLSADGLRLTLGEGRSVLCFSAHTGRELWRLAPLRAQKVHLAVQGHRALLATDTGQLYGVELEDGQVRYRVTAPMPCLRAPVAWGRRAVLVIGRREHTGLIALDADSGAVSWTAQLELSRPSCPLARGRRLFVAGERGGQGVLVALSSEGKLLWERPLPQERAPYFLSAVDRLVLASGGNGAASLFDPSGNLEWRVGASSEEQFEIAPAIGRGVIVLPGNPVRAIDVHGGRLLGEVKARPGLCDLLVDRKLNLYLLDDGGTLQAFHLRSHFAVVSGSGAE